MPSGFPPNNGMFSPNLQNPHNLPPGMQNSHNLPPGMQNPLNPPPVDYYRGMGYNEACGKLVPEEK